MSKNILVENGDASGTLVVVSPLFTYRAFAQGDVATEWTSLGERLNTPEIDKVIVDLAALPFFGSTVLEWMVKIWKIVKNKPGKFALCNVSPVGEQILQAARLHTVWPLYATRAEAVAALTSQA